MKNKILFIAGLSNKKLAQKIEPLIAAENVEQVDLVRREAYPNGPKITWLAANKFWRLNSWLLELWRLLIVLKIGKNYDLIVGCHQFYHGVYAALAGVFWKKPVIQLIIGDVDRSMNKKLSAWAIQKSAACVVRGPISAKILKEKYNYSKPIEIIHNAFEYNPVIASKAEKKYDLITVANNADAKDYPWLFEIISKINFPELKIIICGRNVEKAHQNLIKKLGIEKKVFFAGECNCQELDDYYQASRVFLLTSKTEGLPMVLIEALTHGLPVAATNVGEIPWLIGDQEGKLFNSRDTESAVYAIEELLNNKNLNSVKYIERVSKLKQLFSSKIASQKWQELILKVMKNANE